MKLNMAMAIILYFNTNQLPTEKGS